MLALLTTAVVSYFIIFERPSSEILLAPPVVAGLLVATLVPATALMVLVARRLAMKRATQSPIGGKGRLHVRLVALFSVLATVPTLMVVMFASFLFQSGTAFWFSDRARGMLENATTIAQERYLEELDRVDAETLTMASDIVTALNETSVDTPEFAEFIVQQVYLRNLSEAVLMRISRDNGIQRLAIVNPSERSLERVVRPQALRQLNQNRLSVAYTDNDRIAAIARFPDTDLYLYAARVFDPQLIQTINRSNAVLRDYRALTNRARNLQLRFNAILLVVSLLIVAFSIWIALKLADRLVRPVGELVDAARRVTAGDLSARVPASDARDEVGTLGNAFNRMTRRLEEQTGDLVAANTQLETRRAFTEAVLAGVTAGVISVDDDHVVRLINRSAEALLKTGGQSPVGQKLADLAPELDRQISAREREDVVQFAARGEPRTLAVKTVRVKGGHVLTFDDITEQLLDQRRAAWSDVARRIAHEIKNPLTPIQLAAERVLRKHQQGQDVGPALEEGVGIIVREVETLKAMVDEFSRFARMPRPQPADVDLAGMVQETVKLYRSVKPGVEVASAVDPDAARAWADPEQLRGALINLLDNAVEATEAPGRVDVRTARTDGRVQLVVADTGRGIPPEAKEKLFQPHFSTKGRGTGLGLAIVHRVVSDLHGTIRVEDNPPRGTVFTIELPAR